MRTDIKIIAFDADDTLWSNEPFFQGVENQFCELLKGYATEKELSGKLFQTEMQNLSMYGFGAKGFTLSMVETALKISDGKIPGEIISQIINLGKTLLNMPITLLDGVQETLDFLNRDYSLIVATKGDLLDQQRKLDRSGIAHYFDHIEIMSDKRSEDYQKLMDTLDVDPKHFIMIGNSLKSDILPVLSIGGNAVYVPFEIMWKHEILEDKIDHPRFKEVVSIRDIQQLL